MPPLIGKQPPRCLQGGEKASRGRVDHQFHPLPAGQSYREICPLPITAADHCAVAFLQKSLHPLIHVNDAPFYVVIPYQSSRCMDTPYNRCWRQNSGYRTLPVFVNRSAFSAGSVYILRRVNDRNCEPGGSGFGESRKCGRRAAEQRRPVLEFLRRDREGWLARGRLPQIASAVSIIMTTGSKSRNYPPSAATTQAGAPATWEMMWSTAITAPDWPGAVVKRSFGPASMRRSKPSLVLRTI